MSKDTYKKLLRDGAPEPDFADFEARLKPRRPRWLLPAIAAASALLIAIAVLRPEDDSSGMTIYVQRSDQPASEALEIQLRDWRNADAKALFGNGGGRGALARGGARRDAR